MFYNILLANACFLVATLSSLSLLPPSLLICLRYQLSPSDIYYEMSERYWLSLLVLLDFYLPCCKILRSTIYRSYSNHINGRVGTLYNIYILISVVIHSLKVLQHIPGSHPETKHTSKIIFITHRSGKVISFFSNQV